MKHIFVSLVILFTIGLSAHGSQLAGSESLNKTVVQSEDQAQYLVGAADRRFSADRPRDCVTQWKRESKSAVKSLSILESLGYVGSNSTSAPGRQFNPWQRTARYKVRPADSSVFTAGPALNSGQGCVDLLNGELVLKVNEISAPKRASMGFQFTRTWCSLVNYSGPLGCGWDHNHNVRIVADAPVPDDASAVTLLDGTGRKAVFTKIENQWLAQPGVFLTLKWSNDFKSAFVTDGNNITREFERVISVHKLASSINIDNQNARWRIKRITRYTGTACNELRYEYDRLSGQLKSVTDPFGNVFRFSYTSKGLLAWVCGAGERVIFEYNADSCMTAAVRPAIALSLREKTDKRTEYTYEQISNRPAIVKIATDDAKTHVEIAYQEAESNVRVVKISSVPDSDSEENSIDWKFTYASPKPGETTATVTPPKPYPQQKYTFTCTEDILSTVEKSIDSRNALWSYRYNENGLIEKIQTPDGQVRQIVYESSSDARLQANIPEEFTTAPAGSSGQLAQQGVKRTFVPGTSLVSSVEYYQVDRSGVRSVLGQEQFQWSKPDDQKESGWQLDEKTSFDVRTRYYYNGNGETAIQLNADGSGSVFSFGDRFPGLGNRITASDGTDDFVSGSVTGDGLCVEVTEDASESQLQAAARLLKITLPSRPKELLPPVEQRTKYQYNERGEVVGCQTDRQTVYKYVNRIGQKLLEYDSRSGLSAWSYNRQFEKTALLKSFTPGQPKEFDGEKLFGFTGCFFRQTFVYNNLSQITEWTSTSEQDESGHLPVWRYERTPSGLLTAVTDPMGVRRVTEYNGQGQKTLTRLVGSDDKCTVLESGFTYSPEGRLLSYKDNAGSLWQQNYDGLGNLYQKIAPDGTVTTFDVNGRGQTVSETVTDVAGKVVSRTETVYGPSGPVRVIQMVIYGKPRPSRQADDEGLTVAEFRYDCCGRVSQRRDLHADSWTSFVYDGLGRRRGILGPNGEQTIVCYQNGNAVYEKKVVVNETTLKPFSSGVISVFDNADRAWLRVPVDSNGEMLTDRAEILWSDIAGNTVMRKTGDGTTVSTIFNTSGQPIEELIQPGSRRFGEKDRATKYHYNTSGTIVSRTTINSALAIFDLDESKTLPTIKPCRFEDAPQTIAYQYDTLGRQTVEIQPDGLTIRKTYNDASKVTKVQWYDNSSKELRSLVYEYDKCNRVNVIRDGNTDQVVRSLKYDAVGNIVEAVDSTGEKPVTIRRTYDSLGVPREEKVIWDGKELGRKEISTNPAQGEQTLCWSDLGLVNQFWRSMTFVSNASGQINSLKLDGSDFAEWKYQGDQIISRTIGGSCLTQTRTINSSGELVHQQIQPVQGVTDDESGPVISLGYAYSNRGELESARSEIAAPGQRKQSSVEYYQNDSFGNLVSSNQDRFVPEDIGQRRRDLFDASTEIVSGLTQQSRFDQAGNVWVEFQGSRLTTPLIPGEIESTRPLTYWSASEPLPKSAREGLTNVQLQALASNRSCSQMTVAGEQSTVNEYHYDGLGGLTEFDGIYTPDDPGAGEKQIAVRWKLDYDIFGRLASMTGTRINNETDAENTDAVITDTDNTEKTAKAESDEVVARLNFSYDAFNRRLIKQVIDRPSSKSESETTTATLYERDRPSVVLQQRASGQWRPLQQYLWGADSQELLMTVMSRQQAQGYESDDMRRYYIHQDRGYSVVAATAIIGSKISLVSMCSYKAFGENSTHAEIQEVRTSMDVESRESCYDNHLDDGNDTVFKTNISQPYIELELEQPQALAELRIFARSLPKVLDIFVVPNDVKSPTAETFDSWQERLRQLGCSERVQTHGCSLDNPLKVHLYGLRSNRIVISWPVDANSESDKQAAVREFEVSVVPQPCGEIAFAGQWLDRQTGLYYQLNRYRLPELTGKFITPDPLGFADGVNYYAYAHNNPLSWHDPDGHFAHIIAGAAIGGLFGATTYALQAWWYEEEFSWTKLGVATLAGATGGAITAATGSFAAGDAARGFILGFGNSIIDGNDMTTSFRQGLASGIESGALGLAFGGLNKILKHAPVTQGLNRYAHGAIAGAISKGAYGAYIGYKATKTINGALIGARIGAMEGAIDGMMRIGIMDAAESFSGVEGRRVNAIGNNSKDFASNLADGIDNIMDANRIMNTLPQIVPVDRNSRELHDNNGVRRQPQYQECIYDTNRPVTILY